MLEQTAPVEFSRSLEVLVQLEAEIQDIVNRLDVALIEEASNANVIRARLAADGALANTAVSSLPTMFLKSRLAVAVWNYRRLCSNLGIEPKKLVPQKEPEEGWGGAGDVAYVRFAPVNLG